jgi:hypothetical protein
VPVGYEPTWLTAKLPTDLRQYPVALDPSDAAAIASMSVAAAPSGDGELAIAGLTFTPATGSAVLTLGSGQPTRRYTLLLTLTRVGGLVSDYLIAISVGPVLSGDQAPAAPSTGFGSPVAWSRWSMNFSLPQNTTLLL